MTDRNFNDLAQRFQRNVYGGAKGQLRLQVLQRDFADYLPALFADQPLTVFDAGAGAGQMAVYCAELGHAVTACDVSDEMLAIARARAEQAKVSSSVKLVQQSIQAFSENQNVAADLVICHAVLEWVEDPLLVLRACLSQLKPGGYLSLIYYNRHGLIYKNLLRTNFKKIQRQQWQGYRGSLTPTNPLLPDTVNQWVDELGLEVLCESGIRVFHDYIFNQQDRERDPEALQALELAYSRQAPYKHLGRYIHLLLRKDG